MDQTPSFACPVCESIDRVTKVSALVGAGTSSGSAATFTSKGSYAGSTTVTSRTGTAQAFTKPWRPLPPAVFACAWALVGMFVGAMTQQGLVIWAAAGGAAAIYWWRRAAKRQARREAWPDAARRLNAAYYCERDDVAYELGGAPVPPRKLTADLFGFPYTA